MGSSQIFPCTHRKIQLTTSIIQVVKNLEPHGLNPQNGGFLNVWRFIFSRPKPQVLLLW